jgi:hypothetical protein
MTTIALRDGILAADSQTVRNDMITGRIGKILRLDLGRGFVSGAGDLASLTAWRDWCDSMLCGRSQPAPKFENFAGILIGGHKTRGVWRHENASGLYPVEVAPYYAWGSGSQFAMGAMHAGANAVQAVLAAISLDPWTGGSIQTVDVSRFFKEKLKMEPEFERYMVSNDHSEWRPARRYADGRWTDENGAPIQEPLLCDERLIKNETAR